MTDIDLKLMGIISLLYPDRQIEFHMKYDIGIIIEMKMKFNIDLSIAEIIEYIKQGYLLNVTPQEELKTGMIALSQKATEIISNGTLMKIWTSIPQEMRIAFLEGGKSKSSVEIFGYNDVTPAREKNLKFYYRGGRWSESMYPLKSEPYKTKLPCPLIVRTNMGVGVRVEGADGGFTRTCYWKGKNHWQDVLIHADRDSTYVDERGDIKFDRIDSISLKIPLLERNIEITRLDKIKNKIRAISLESCKQARDEIYEIFTMQRTSNNKTYDVNTKITLHKIIREEAFKAMIKAVRKMKIKVNQTKLAKVSIRIQNPETPAGERCFIGFDKEKCMTYAKTDMNAKTYGHFDVKNGNENIRVSLHIWGISYKIKSIASITLPIEPILDIVDRMDEFKLKKDSMHSDKNRDAWIGSYRRYVRVKNDGRGNLVFTNSKEGEFHISWHDIMPKLIQTLNKAVNKEIKIVNQQLEYKVKYNRFMDKWKRYTDFKLPDEVKKEETSDDIYKKYYGDKPQVTAQEGK